jgi:hypothetical protein
VVCLLNDDELAVLKKEEGAKPNEYRLVGHYYRMRDDGAGMGRTKLLDPHIAKLKSTDPKQVTLGLRGLEGYRSAAWPAMPDVVRILESGDPSCYLYARSLIRVIGPKARDAVPALRKHLQQFAVAGDYKNVQDVLWALAEIGPDAREALPDIRKLKGPFIETQRTLQKIEGTP